MNTMNAAQKAQYLESQLRNFCGTENWYRHPLFRQFLYTDGVQFLGYEAGAYWLIDMIFGFQREQKAVRNEPFQTWDLIKGENNKATLTCGDGNNNIVFTHDLTYTDFPLDKIRLFLIDNVLLLTSEY